MTAEEQKREEEVFGQRLEVDELDASGGASGFDVFYGDIDDDRSNCTQFWHRRIYGADGNSFPNCAATVGDDSNCYRNDGCYSDTVVYDGMRTDCGRTWR